MQKLNGVGSLVNHDGLIYDLVVVADDAGGVDVEDGGDGGDQWMK